MFIWLVIVITHGAHLYVDHGGYDLNDAFVAKLTPNGVLTWNTFFGSTSGTDEGYDIAVDGNKNVYFIGTSNVGWGTPVRAYGGGDNAFVGMLDSNGTLIWNTFLGARGRSLWSCYSY